MSVVACVPNVIAMGSSGTTVGASASSSATDASASSSAAGAGGSSSASSSSGSGSGGATCNEIGFTPSNFSLASLGDVCGLEDAEIKIANCTFDTLDPQQTCTTQKVRQVILSQGEGLPKLAVWIAKSWLFYPNVQVNIAPGRPVVFVAIEASIDIEGELSVSASSFEPTAGGYAYPTSPVAPNGVASAAPSGGGAGSSTNAAGGGGFCGMGGDGAAWPGGIAASGGAVTGNEHIIPLVGGSPGGAGAGFPGAGGGAIQLVAAAGVIIGVNGLVTANGGVGGDAMGAWMADGGGSGGAILIEATTVSTPGAVLANGGPGGRGGEGDAVPGGSGSMSDTPHGLNGACPTASCFPQTGAAASAGGGGAGWVRINTSPPVPTQLGGVHSPTLKSKCYTFGAVGQ